MSRVTWKWVRESKFPALVAMARRAGLDPSGWTLTNQDTPRLVLGEGPQFCCHWSTARECADYMQAWIDALSIVAAQLEDRRRVLEGYGLDIRKSGI